MTGVWLWTTVVAAAGAAALVVPHAVGPVSRGGAPADRVSWPVAASDAAPPRASALWAALAHGALGSVLAAAAQWLTLGRIGAFWCVMGCCSALLARVAWGWRVRRRERCECARAVQECCEALAEELAAGRTPLAALDAAADAWAPLRAAVEAFDVGLEVPAVLRRLAQRPGAAELRLVGAAWEVGQESGQGLAAALRRGSETLAAGGRTARGGDSQLAPARAAARMVALLPVAALLMGAGSGGDPIGFLVGTGAGNLCVALGLTLTVVGLAWIELLADRATR